jgi:hypothetical protein
MIWIEKKSALLLTAVYCRIISRLSLNSKAALKQVHCRVLFMKTGNFWQEILGTLVHDHDAQISSLIGCFTVSVCLLFIGQA